MAEQTGGADPLTDYGTNSMYLLIPHVLEPLLHIELLPEGNAWGVVLDLAERWSFTDSTTLVVELKKGRAVPERRGADRRARQVRLRQPSSTPTSPVGGPCSCEPSGRPEIVDRYTIRWHMPAPNSSALGGHVNLLVPPLARRGHDRGGVREQAHRHRSVQGGRVAAGRDGAPGSLGRLPPRQTVSRATHVRTVPEPSTRVLELLAGSAQIAQTVPIESIGSIEGNPKLEVVSLKGSARCPT